MRVYFKNDTKWIFYIAHAIWLLSWVVFFNGHTLLTTVGYDLFYETFDIGILDTEMEETCILVLEFRVFFVIICKLKELNTDAIRRDEMSDFEIAMTFTENLFAHDAYSTAILFLHKRWFHDDVPAHDISVKGYCFLKIRNG